MSPEIEMREIRIFLALARELHFGRTAEQLFISRARVSQAVQSLERNLGGPLFERSSRSVTLTAAGQELRDRVAPAYDEIRSAVEAVRSAWSGGVQGALRLGLPNPVNGGPHLLEIVQRFRTMHPACEVRVGANGLQESPLRALRSGAVDVAALRLPLQQPDLEIGPVLSREARVLLVAIDDPLAQREAIEYDDIGERRVSRNPVFPPETMEAFIPSVTPRGRVLRRIDNESVEQVMLRVALGEQVHPTVGSWLDHHGHAGVTAVPILDLPASETALVRVRGVHIARTTAFFAVAADVLAGREL